MMQEFQSQGREVVDHFKQEYQQAEGKLQGDVGDMVEGVGGVLDAIGEAVQGAVEAFGDFGPGLGEMIEDKLGAGGELSEALGGIVGETVEGLTEVNGEVAEAMGSIAGSLIENYGEAIEDIGEGINKITEHGDLKGGLGDIADVPEDLAERNELDSLGETVEGAAEIAGEVFEAGGEIVREGIEGIVEPPFEAGRQLGETLTDAVHTK
jgi:hypothetical protein